MITLIIFPLDKNARDEYREIKLNCTVGYKLVSQRAKIVTVNINTLRASYFIASHAQWSGIGWCKTFVIFLLNPRKKLGY